MDKRVIFLIVMIWMLAVVGSYAADMRQGIFHHGFKTLKVTREDNEFAPPVIMLGDVNDRIRIEFDELSEERRFMRYELVHCDALWRPEGLVASEFLDGFNEGLVEDYDFSQATLAHYVHYTITIPNQDIRITQPGNYLVRVYDESDPDETLLQARFGVTDFTAKIDAGVTTRTDIDTNREHQQVSVTVDTRHVNSLDDPFGDLTVVVTQNGREDNKVVLTAPQRVAGDKVIYEHLRPLIFEAGNEYRRFETVSTTYPGMGVAEITYADPLYNMTLYTDTPRSMSSYLYDSTQHGRFFVREGNSVDSDLQADYVVVHFALEMPQLPGKDLFLDGDFVSRRFDPNSRMVYNHATGCYENSMLLKQGAYNYKYLAVPAGSTRGSEREIEGNFYETVNEYTVMVYHRPRGSRFDRLIGVAMISSGE